MIAIPFLVDESSYNVFLVLEEANIERMRVYDPAQFDFAKLPQEWQAKRVNLVLIGYATSEELATLHGVIAREGLGAALQMLSRGFRYRPEAGDNDENYGEVKA